MGRLIIDGNSVFEIDEECLKSRPPLTECEIDKYIQKERWEHQKDVQIEDSKKR